MYKVMFVEDEAGIRHTVLECFDWDSLDCIAVGAASGLDALNMCLRSTPDVVITDIVMPGIDGMTLIRYLKHEFPDIRFIVVTSYREFTYAKESLDMGVQAFLLKPIDEEELRSAILKAIESIQSDWDQFDQTNISESEEKYLFGLLNGYVPGVGRYNPPSDSMLASLSAYAVAVMRFDSRQDVGVINQHRLLNFCRTINYKKALPCARIGEHLAFIYPIQNRDSQWRSQVRVYFSEVLQYIRETLHFSVSVGISGMYTNLRNAGQAYLSAMRAVRHQFFAGKACVILYDDISGSSETIGNAYSDCEFVKSIDDILRNGSINSLEKGVDGHFEYICRNHGGDVDRCRSRVFSILLMCFVRLTGNNTQAQADILSRYDYFRSILSAETLSQIKEFLLIFLLDLRDYHSVKTVENKQAVVERILEYLETHYAETVTLSDVARLVYLSPAYVSTLISGETGKTLIDNLNSIRVRRAIELMKNTNMKLYEIAAQVGFNEAQYFSIVFKKYTGTTPSEYRQMYFT